MDFELFDRNKHLDIIKKWWSFYGWHDQVIDFLPPYAIVGIFNNQVVTACWLYRDKCKLCIAEGLIINPETERHNRNEIIDRTINFVLQDAKSQGYTRLMALIRIEKLRQRLLNDFGFVQMHNDAALFKELV